PPGSAPGYQELHHCTAKGITNSVITALVLLKSGNKESLSTTFSLVRTAVIPPTSGILTRYQAAAIAPPMATKNSRKSVYTTPLNPPRALKVTVINPALTTVTHGSSPNMIPPILIAAKVTADMVITLKMTPR